ncbi:MAG: Ribosomal prokaryotic protein, partial [Candidatus Parcubacteria bacterium]
ALGTPYLSQTVQAKIVSHGRADKIRVVKFQSKKRYMRTIGHRQDQTVLSIESIA